VAAVAGGGAAAGACHRPEKRVVNIYFDVYS
jgi:hypothetical protein